MSTDQIISTRRSPNITALEVPFQDVLEEDGRLESIEFTNSTKAVGVSEGVGDQVDKVAHSRV